MNAILSIFFCALFFSEFLYEELHLIPKKATYLIDLFPIGILAYSLLYLAIAKKFIFVRKYLAFFLFYIGIMLVGMMINGTNPFSIIIGLRFYLKQLPLFLLPLVLYFSDKDIEKQFYVLLFLMLLQTPVAVYQRLFAYAGVHTGDVITGTTGSSTTLTILVLFTLAYLLALKLNNRVKLPTYIFLSVWVFIAATINETKITFILTPFLFLFTSYLQKEKRLSAKLQKILAAFLVMLAALAIFVPIYDTFMKPRTEYGILEFFFEKDDELKRYIYKGTAEQHRIRRGDALYLSFREQSRDLGRLLFGLGMANVIESGLSEMDMVQKKRLQYRPEMLTITTLVWELGIFGLAAHILIFVFIFIDSLKLRRSEHGDRALGLCWCTVTAIMVICFFYTNYIRINLLNYIYWFVSGIVISRAYTIDSRHSKVQETA